VNISSFNPLVYCWLLARLRIASGGYQWSHQWGHQWSYQWSTPIFGAGVKPSVTKLKIQLNCGA